MHRAFAIGFAILVAACARLPDREVFISADRSEIAIVPGFNDARAWADIPPTDVVPELANMLDSYAPIAIAQGEVSMLAISGGGAFGAFAAGMLNGWTTRGDRPEWVLVTGVSTGALIAPFAFAGPRWDDALAETYTTTTDEKVFRFLGLSGLLGDIAIGDTAPLRATLERYVDLDFLAEVAEQHRRGRRLWIGTTEFDSRRPMIWDLGRIALRGTEEARRLFIDAMLASASIPVAFPPVTIESISSSGPVTELHVDGGVTRNVLGWPGSHFSRLLGEHSKIGHLPRRAYIIVNSPLDAQPEKLDGGIVEIANASISVLIDGNTLGDLYRMHWQALNEGFEFRLAYVSENVESEEGAFFDPAAMSMLFDSGVSLINSPEPWTDLPPGLPPGSVGLFAPKLK